jgi:DnaJ-domain-containing protein 1
MRIFNLDKEASLSDIKREFRQRVKSGHPDAFTVYNFPPEVMKLINENFSRLKDAYYFLLENHFSNPRT